MTAQKYSLDQECVETQRQRRATDRDGSRLYEVEFQDGHTASMTANAKAENLFAQVDDEGNQHILFEEIMHHQANGRQLTHQDAFNVNRSGTKQRKETTVGRTAAPHGSL